jgi:hypothetical protein
LNPSSTTSYDFQQVLDDHQALASIGSVGDAYWKPLSRPRSFLRTAWHCDDASNTELDYKWRLEHVLRHLGTTSPPSLMRAASTTSVSRWSAVASRPGR